MDNEQQKIDETSNPTLIEITNAVLKIITRSKVRLAIIQIVYTLITEDMPGLVDKKGLADEIEMILKKLIKDGYVEKIKKTDKNNYDEYLITWEGQQFALDNGYKEDFFLDLPTINPAVNNPDNTKHKPNNFKKWITKNKDDIIVGIIVTLIATLLIWFITKLF
jgi:hypothetical protein